MADGTAAQTQVGTQEVRWKATRAERQEPPTMVTASTGRRVLALAWLGTPSFGDGLVMTSAPLKDGPEDGDG